MTTPSAPSTDAPHRVSKESVKMTIRHGAKEVHTTVEEIEAATSALKARPAGIAADQLRSVIERIERLEEEKAGIASDIKDIFAEAKGNGFEVKILRKVIALRKMDAAERDEAEHMLNTYLSALGMQSSFNFEDEQ